MPLKLFAASVVLLVGVALASLFPKNEQLGADQSMPIGVALRRDTPLSEMPQVASSTRGNSLPSVEAAVMTQPESRSRARYAPTSTDRNPFRSPPSMPSDYRTAAAQRPLSTADTDQESAHTANPRPRSTERPREVLHRVVDGDTLAALAARYLGDAALADRIWRANQERLPENPNWLPIGAELRIPPASLEPRSEVANVAPSRNAETRLVPIDPAPVVADTHTR